ncbi:DUF1697 domain-containing protein [Ascidiimonas sp. W6]|uniref:DUF1697 domain-containing protein n=1 Tax=Ascidiimonas meishanensis TaxID=3128903 RepID=UPI0030EEB8C1
MFNERLRMSKKYVLLLRAVNVGGRNLIKMANLRHAFEEHGFLNVKTYIQSGNVVFEVNNKFHLLLKQKVATILKENFDYELAFVLIDFEIFLRILDTIPASYTKLTEHKKIFVSFLAEKPLEENIIKLHSFSNDNENYLVNGTVVYVWCLKDGRKLNFSNKWIERLLQVSATTRNLNTVKRLATY